ncbi:MAG: histone deacetylase family protein [Pseudomonadales bacterium]|jgi:acetoin utilization deacetylase AcuC-like enzyme|nr:histone deacetylase family protein [Pseudomonadales bacterium]
MKVFFDPRQQLHDPQSYLSRGQMRRPQEVPARSDEILKGLRALGHEILQPDDHGRAPIEAVHDAGYLDFLEHGYRRWHEVPEDWGEEVLSNVFVRSAAPPRGILAEAAYYLADGSCPVGEHTWTAAYWAAQGALSAAAALRAGDRVAYAACRPPGHHARRDAAGGFCYLNNGAIAAQALIERFPRIAVLDPDMHHGQGVQEIFYDRDDVLYVSIHGDTTNFYPAVTGFEEERGVGAGEGFNLNLPMPHGSSEDVFFSRLAEAVAAIDAFGPDALVVTLGFDVHEKDPQAKVAVSSDGFRRLGETVAAFGRPLLVVQEGGYYLEGLAENSRQFFTGVAGL